MGKAGQALKQVLAAYGISQNQLAVAMGVDRSNISRWVSESRDPTAEAAAEIKNALEKINSAAANDFVKYYLYGTSKDSSSADGVSQDGASGVSPSKGSFIGDSASQAGAIPNSSSLQASSLDEPNRDDASLMSSVSTELSLESASSDASSRSVSTKTGLE